MSALRKALQRKERERLDEIADQLDDSVESEPEVDAPVNPFAAAFGSSSDEDAVSEEDAGDEDVPVVAPVKEIKKSKKRQKQKKKKKKKKKNASGPAVSDPQDIDQLISELDKDVEVKDPGRNDSQLLVTDGKFFNAEAEIIRRFGAKVLKAEGEGRKVGTKHRFRKRTVLIRYDEDWPSKTSKDLEMKLEDTVGSIKYFTFVPTEDYRRLQIEFEDCVATNNPQAIAHFVREYPYHVDALVQMSQIYLHHQQLEAAITLVERCIFTYETCFSADFTFLEGNCRLDYNHKPNRSLFHAINRYSRHVGRKGCTRTALEFTKLLLSFDPVGDPCCSLVMIDYWAIRSREFAFLESLVDQFRDSKVPAHMYPNLAYSCALSKFYAERGNNQSLPTSTTEKDFAIPSAEPVPGELKSANASEMMQWALLMFPEVLEPLIMKAKESELRKPRWKDIIHHNHFRKASDTRAFNAYRGKMVHFFVERSHSLWKADQVIDWLYEQAHSLVPLLDGGFKVADFETRSRELYNTPTPVKFRVLAPWEYSDAAVPPLPDDFGGVMQAPNMLEDNYVNLDVRGQNPLLVFLQTMLPWVHVTDGDGHHHQHHE